MDLQLVSVQHLDTTQQAEALRRFLARLLAAQDIGDSVESIVGTGIEPDPARITWRLRVGNTARRVDFEVGLADAYAASRAAGLEFIQSHPYDARSLPWCARWSPAPIVAGSRASRPIGFACRTPTEASTVCFARPWAHLASLDRFLPLLAQTGVPALVRVVMTRVKLQPRQHAQVRDLFVEMCRSGVSPDQRTSTDPDGGQLLANLRAWAEVADGVRFVVELRSPGPVPVSLMRAFSDCLGTPGVPLREPKAMVAAPAQATLDLRDCVSLGDILPLLVPRHDALLHGGTRRRVPHTPAPPIADGLVLGRTVDGNRPLALSADDRMRHVYCCGATGTGKSTLLLELIHQDLVANHGVCVIDPHGDLFLGVLDRVPAARVSEVVVIDPGDPEAVAGLNLLECGGPSRRLQVNFAVNELIRIFERLYNMTIAGGPVFEQYMRNALLLLLENDLRPQTLLQLPAVFEDDKFRKALLRRCHNPAVASFWRLQAERVSGELGLANLAPYITSKLNQFTTNHVMRGIVGQARPRFSVSDVMDRGGIVLINLSKGLIGELDAHLLGMVLLAKIFAAALGRISQPYATRRPFFVYVDEFQNMATSTMQGMLAEARKFGVGMTLANQTLAQLPTGPQLDLASAVLGNCGSLVTFRTGPADAERLSGYVKPHLSAADLQALPNFEAVARILSAGVPAGPFVFRTTPGVAPPTQARAVLDASRSTYGVSIEVVERDNAEAVAHVLDAQ